MVSLNSKVCSFPVQTLIQKDNTDNKVLETNFIQRNKKKKKKKKDEKD